MGLLAHPERFETLNNQMKTVTEQAKKTVSADG